MKRAQEWLSTIKATLPDQDTNTEVKEILQEITMIQVILPLTDWFSRELSGLSLEMEKTTGSSPLAMDVSMAQMLACKSLSAVAEGIRC
jgi:maltodextrin utilization protein YvdJ